MLRTLMGLLVASALAGPVSAAEEAVAKSTTENGVVTVDSWNARYCEFLIVKGTVLKVQAEVWNTLGLNTCDGAAFKAVDPEAIRKQFQARGVVKNGPRHWVVSKLSTPQETKEAPVESFGGIEARLVGELALPPGMRKAPVPYKETTVERRTRYEYAAGRPVFLLDDPTGMTWVMQAYSLAVDPRQTLDRLPELGKRLRLPKGWTFRTETLDTPLIVQPVNGSARILQDELQNTYDACFEGACDRKP